MLEVTGHDQGEDSGQTTMGMKARARVVEGTMEMEVEVEVEVEDQGGVDHRYVLTHTNVERFADNKISEDYS